MSSPYTSIGTTTFDLSGINTIDGLLNPDNQKWSPNGSAILALTYSFPWLGGTFAYWQSDYDAHFDPQRVEHLSFNTSQIVAATSALQAWADVASITFTEISETVNNVGDFRFAFSFSVSNNVWGYCNYPDDSSAAAADVWINPAYAQQSDWSKESYNYFALMHEIGHGLGLKHPGNYSKIPGIYLPAELDFRTYTVMSYYNMKSLYFDQVQHKYINVYPQSPMVYDIAAIQYLYGANNKYNIGDNIYSFDPSLPFYKTIWDANGTDTINLSNFATNCIVDLNEGHYSSLHYINQGTGLNLYDGTDNLGIAFGVTIENASGGSGNDNIIGNSVDNHLLGGGGNDTLTGGSGNDTIDGGQGNDTALFTGNEHNYTITPYPTGFSVKDTLGSEGTDFLVNVENIQFADHTLTISVTPDSNLVELYRIYTTLDRTPDYAGLGFWYNSVLNGGSSVTAVAEGIMKSNEFIALYGENPTDSTFLTLLYQHILGRTPDHEGYNYWLNSLQSINRAQELINFAESAENKEHMAGVIADGIIYEAYTS